MNETDQYKEQELLKIYIYKQKGRNIECVFDLDS